MIERGGLEYIGVRSGAYFEDWLICDNFNHFSCLCGQGSSNLDFQLVCVRAWVDIFQT